MRDRRIMSPPVDNQRELTTADVATGLRTELATIRRHWPHTFDPPHTATGAGPTGVPDSKLPGNDTAISLRAEVTRDLAFWIQAMLDDRPELTPTSRRRTLVPIPTLTVTTTWAPATITAPTVLDCGDVIAVCTLLEQEAGWLSGWEHAHRLWDELITLAREVKTLASPPQRDTLPIGECPTCTTVVRAKAHDPGNIRCPGCGTTDTIDGWIIRVVGNEPLVTAEQLVPILHKRMGIVISRNGIRQWVTRQVIPQHSVDDAGRARFDRKAVFAALTLRDARREGRVG